MSEPVIPDVIVEPTRADVLRVMTRAVFQAGVSWAQIANHWEAYEEAFEGFDPARVAAYGDSDVERIITHGGVMRTARKIKATIANARALQALCSDYHSFHEYVASFEDYASIARDVKKRFSFMGDMNVWYLLFRLHEPVPHFEAWVTSIAGEHPRMREMVERARAMGRSAEVNGSGWAAAE
ncbi:MAG TPA: DNA-3-methyladenine glycosylase I [Candidatus Aquilonibacter sp.]|nr:DNA-3-methyladenine glycosylase I [Candidatus Aquilonibacter sp.]